MERDRQLIEQEKELAGRLNARLAWRRLERPSRIATNLDLGGAPHVRVLRGYGHVVRLCGAHEIDYVVVPGTEVVALEMDDSLNPKNLAPLARLEALADHINARRAHASVLVHCRMGINRSALVAALALIRAGQDAREVVAHLRVARSPLVLANQTFERFVRAYPNVAGFYDGTEQRRYEAELAEHAESLGFETHASRARVGPPRLHVKNDK